MSKFCPCRAEQVLYPECLECEHRNSCNIDDVFAILIKGSCTLQDADSIFFELDRMLSAVKNKYDQILLICGNSGAIRSVLGKYAKERKFAFICPQMSDNDREALYKLLSNYKHRGCVVIFGEIQAEKEMTGKYGTPVRIIQKKKEGKIYGKTNRKNHQ